MRRLNEDGHPIADRNYRTPQGSDQLDQRADRPVAAEVHVGAGAADNEHARVLGRVAQALEQRAPVGLAGRFAVLRPRRRRQPSVEITRLVKTPANSAFDYESTSR